MHQAEVRYRDGTVGMFFSLDGRWFFEHKLPEAGARTSPMHYEREWLKQAAQSSSIRSIEFTQVDG